MANEKILVVDDDTNICELLRLYLTNSVCSGPFGPCDKVFHFLLYGRVMTK